MYFSVLAYGATSEANKLITLRLIRAPYSPWQEAESDHLPREQRQTADTMRARNRQRPEA